MKSPYHPEAYDSSRPLYPGEVFDPLRAGIGRQLPGPIRVLDLGAGTGLAWKSFRAWAPDLQAEGILLEPNERLLELALAKAGSEVRGLKSSAEQIELAPESVDLILCGSAWHWMPEQVIVEVERILKPGGGIYIFEYQFPKLESDRKGLNEWVRRQFNEQWRFEDQTPRGTLAEKTESLRGHSRFSFQKHLRLEKVIHHSAELFAELIFTQARYLDFENRIGKQKSLDARTDTLEQVKVRLEDPMSGQFRYYFEAFLFQKRRV